jgi:hypothetical protein
MRRLLSRGEVLLALGLGLVLGAAALLRDELRSPDPSEGWIIGFCVVIAVGAVCLGVTVLEYFRHRGMNEELPNSCGDPKVRRKRIGREAEPLATNLENFKYWWIAVKNKDFDGRLPTKDGGEGHRANHQEAMQTLLHKFACFFSAQYTYQEQCHEHRPLRSVRRVYGALTEDPDGPTDYALRSNQLHVVGKRSTSGWGTVHARPLEFDDFQDKLKNDPSFAGKFKPLEEFLCAAAPGTEALTRLEAVGESVKRVEERLTKNPLQRAFRVLPRLWARATQSSKAAISSRDQM